MARSIAILEDNAERQAEMRAVLVELISYAEVTVFEEAWPMIEWLREHLADVVLISLDHDLPVRHCNGVMVDCGTGQEVVDYLADVPPTCPVIVHTSNEQSAPRMVRCLREKGWPCSRVVPRDGCQWISDEWSAQIRQYIERGWITVQGHKL